MELSITIQPNGDILVPRGSSLENQVMFSILKNDIDDETCQQLQSFFNFIEQREQIFGTEGLCG